MNRFVRRAPFASALGIIILMLLGAGVLPAMAAPEEPPENAATPPASDEVVQALVVGSTAFALMIGAAGAVLYYTARQRHQGREG